jgi:hypothetical protein
MKQIEQIEIAKEKRRSTTQATTWGHKDVK